jgi:hypothetical protein
VVPHDEPAVGGGLRAYLDGLATVARVVGAGHWCTPGHNRGRAVDPPLIARSRPRPLVGRRRREAP